MIDVAVVGAGLTGLALAHRLQALGLQVSVLEARDRVGGRILSQQASPTGGACVDVGASWYWPDTEPRITALIASLGLRSLAQPDEGQILHLADPNRGPEPIEATSIHGGARRLAGGMARLTDALMAQLEPHTVQLGHRVVALRDMGEHIELQLVRQQDGIEHLMRVLARRVVLAMPPRLIAQHLRMQPTLSDATMQALSQVPTWMATQAKAYARYAQPFWLTQGQSGSAFVTHPQAVLREVWDASDGQGAALAGLCTMAPATRQQFARSLPLLVSSQLAQLFGQSAHSDEVHLMDWSLEPWTCSAADLQDTEPMPPQADPLLRRPHWSGRLFFGGTETARQAPGHMEGALESAARLADFLRPVPAMPVNTSQHATTALQGFIQWVEAERQASMPCYQQQLKHLLSRQDADRVTQRALLATAEQTYTRALEQLAQLEFSWPDTVHAGRSEATPQVLAAFSGFSKTLVDEALRFNATSCALSNFAEEHRPSPDYLRAITADLAAAWREFAWATNDLLCARTQAVC